MTLVDLSTAALQIHRNVSGRQTRSHGDVYRQVGSWSQYFHLPMTYKFEFQFLINRMEIVYLCQKVFFSVSGARLNLHCSGSHNHLLQSVSLAYLVNPFIYPFSHIFFIYLACIVCVCVCRNVEVRRKLAGVASLLQTCMSLISGLQAW